MYVFSATETSAYNPSPIKWMVSVSCGIFWSIIETSWKTCSIRCLNIRIQSNYLFHFVNVVRCTFISCHNMIVQVCLKRIEYIGANYFFITYDKQERCFCLVEYANHLEWITTLSFAHKFNTRYSPCL